MLLSKLSLQSAIFRAMFLGQCFLAGQGVFGRYRFSRNYRRLGPLKTPPPKFLAWPKLFSFYKDFRPRASSPIDH